MFDLPPLLTAGLAALLVLGAGCSKGSAEVTGLRDAGRDNCTNDVDRGLIDYGWIDAGQPNPQANNVGQIMEDCALMDCFYEVIRWDGVEECMDPCVTASPAGALTAPCRQCYYQVVNCASVKCVIECSGGSSVECDQCIIDLCDPDLYICSGLSNP